MSRDLLAEVARGASALTPAGRRWEVWPVSITAHALVVGWLFIMPPAAPPTLPAALRGYPVRDDVPVSVVDRFVGGM